MHLTLKLETTKPAARSLLQQQAKFEDFVECYNNERPHRAIDMQYPAQQYRPSPRPYRDLPDLDHPFPDKAVTITTCGRICFNRQKINLSQVFAGQTVGGGSSVVAANVKAAEILHYRNCVASALANGVQSRIFRAALQELGTGGA
jgi:hypothetical protein